MAEAAVHCKVVVLLLIIHCFIVAHIVCGRGDRPMSLFCSAVLNVLSSFTMILLEKKELVVLL